MSSVFYDRNINFKIYTMKKLLLVLAFVVMALASNAQLFVAGNVSARYSGGRTDYNSPMYTTYDDDPKEVGFVVKPAVGYMIPGKNYGFGLSLGYAYNSVKDYDYTANEIGDVVVHPYEKRYSNIFEVGPFFRYAYARFDKITLYADLKIPVNFGKVKEETGRDIKDTDYAFAIGARLIPGLTYKFNDHILFTTEIGLLSINYTHNINTKVQTNVVKIDNDFEIGANNRTVASFGFVYLF